MATIALGLSTLTREQNLQLATNIKTGVTSNPNVPTPNPTPAALGTLITTATTKLTAYEAHEVAGKALLLDLNNSFAALNAGLTLEAVCVQDATGGDPIKIATTNMPIRKPSLPIGPLGQVLALVVVAGENAGELKVSWKKLRGAKSYEVQISADPFTATSWIGVAPSAKVRTVIGGLTSGAKMWVRVRGIGADGPGVWSDVATMIVP